MANLRRMAACLAMAAMAVLSVTPAQAADLRIGVAAPPSAMDPHFHLLASNMSVMAHMFETMVAQDEQQKLVPGLAPGDRVVLERNDRYWGPKEKWDRVIITAVPSAASRTAALLSGDADIVEKAPGEDVARLRANPKVKVIIAPSNSVNYIVIDQYRDASPGVSGTGGRNPLRDVRVRHALSMALNREALTERMMSGLAVPAAELAAPTMFGANADAQVQKYDPDGARRLLEEAGYGGGFGLVLVTTNGFYVQDAQMRGHAATDS